MLMTGCGDELRAHLRLSVNPGASVQVNETVTLDATESDYDFIEWKLDDSIYGPCMTEPKCEFSFSQADNHTVWVEVTMDHRPHWSGLSRSRQTHDSGMVLLTWLP